MRVLLFDIDGTLIRSGGAGKAAMEAALADAFGVSVIDDRVPYSGRTDRAIALDLLAHYGIPPTEENRQRLQQAYLKHLPDYLRRVPGEVLPGVAALLEGLHPGPGVALGLLTGNVRPGAECKLRHYGLWGYFAFGGFGDRHTDRDDVAREALREAEAHVCRGVNCSSVWVIGDTPLDVRCARAIGARAVAVATGWHSADELAASRPDVLLPHLGEAAELLREWTARNGD